MNNSKDKVILITGAGKGSGSLLARAFAERGAIVAANDISPVNVEGAIRVPPPRTAPSRPTTPR